MISTRRRRAFLSVLAVPLLGGLIYGGMALADQVIPEDVITQGSLCVGLDCVDGESFGFDTIRLKENNLRIAFVDTSASAGFPTRDWQIVANDSASGGAEYLAFNDVDAATFPFRVDGAAPTNALRVADNGNIGAGTAAPILDIHVRDNDTPALRMEQDNSGGFTAQTWDIAGNEANFFVRDVTNGSRLPFRVRPGAPTSSIDISSSGFVGFGNASPDAPIDVTRVGTGNAAAKLANPAGSVALQLDALDNGSFWNITSQATGDTSTVTGPLVINNNDAAGVEFSLSKDGDLTLEGDVITQSCPTGCGPADFVFEPDYELMTIDELESYVTANKHLPNVPSARDVSENGVKLSFFSMRLLEKIEEQALYIIEQSKTIGSLQSQIDSLESRLAALESQLSGEE